MKKMISTVMMVVLAAACAAFGGTYEPGKVYGPISILGNEARTIDGNGAILDGGGTNRCATLGPNVTLKNFTFRNGKAAVGGGVWGGRIENCTIRDCIATEYGAAVVNCKVSQTAISGCQRPLDGAVKAAMHGGLAADSTLDGVTITGCRVELGTTAPGFGGIAANSALNGCTVTDNSLVVSGDHYGLLFYGGSVGDSKIRLNSVNSSLENIAAYMKVAPADCTLDEPDAPAVDPERFDGSVANTYMATLPDGSLLVVSTARASGSVVSLTAQLTVGKTTCSYTGGKMVDGTVVQLPTSRTYGAPAFDKLELRRNAMSGAMGDGTDFSGRRLSQDVFDSEAFFWRQDSASRVGVAFAAKVGVGELCGPVRFFASNLPSGLKLDAATGEITGIPTKAGDSLPRISAASTVNSRLTTWRDFPIAVDGLDDWATGIFSASGDGRQVTFTVSAAGKISGTMTEGKDKWTISAGSYSSYANGAYAVVLTCKKKGREDRSVEVVLTEDGLVGTEAGGSVFTGFQLRQTNFDWDGAVLWRQISPIRVGVAFAAQLSVNDRCGPVKYAASKLPAGLKINKTTGEISGVPTKAKEYQTQITATSTVSSKFKAKKPFPIVVEALDGWAIGTFNGGGTNCQAKVTVSKTGKISGQLLTGGLKWTLSAKSFDDYAEGVYTAALTCKNGKTTCTNCVITVSENGLVGACDEVGGEFLALRNEWKDDEWKPIAKGFPKAAPLVLQPVGEGFDTNDTITLKFATSGAVTAKGRFVKSYNSRTGKPSFYSVSRSSVLCPLEGPDTNGAFSGAVYVYYPPKKNTPIPSGYIDCVKVRWTGSRFELDDE